MDISGWTLTEHPTQQAVFSTVTDPGRHEDRRPRPLPARPVHLRARGPGQGGRHHHQRAQHNRDEHRRPDRDRHRRPGRGRDDRRHPERAAHPGRGSPGRLGNAVKLNGADEYVSLPTGIVSALSDFTVSAWVNPASDDTWSRVFDFGTGTAVNMFMTVNGGGAGLRFAITNNGNGAEQTLTGGGQLPLNTWSHVAVTLSGTTGTLYLNGTPVAINPNMTLKPSSLGNTNQNWIGRSQYPDPCLNGTVDDFNIYNRALSPADVAALAGGQPGAGQRRRLQVRRERRRHRHRLLRRRAQRHDHSAGSAATASTPLWQPLPDGPVITIPAALDQRPGHQHGRLHGRAEGRHRLRRQARGGHGRRDRQGGHPGKAGGAGIRGRHQHQGRVHRQYLGG